MQNTASVLNTQVAIVGAGPAGLMLAIELGCRSVPCVLFDAGLDAPTAPKANATSARTMEHFRRRGFAHRVRAAGLTPDHPQDVLYCTRLLGHEIARFRIPSRADVASGVSFGDYTEAAWPTPELPHRVQQMLVEKILREEVAKYPCVSTHYGWQVNEVNQNLESASLQAKELATQKTVSVNAKYLVGCDGPRSLVRKAMGVQYEGASAEQQAFFGGQMLSIHFRSPDLYERLTTGPLKNPAWMTWIMNAQQRGVLVAINGLDEFAIGIQLKPGQGPGEVNIAAVLQDLAGTSHPPFAYEVISLSPWTAGFMLVAQQFKNGRLLIAGDAAHLFTPTGGMGYNTSVDDTVNLGWKLAAICQGWGDATLLETYHAERHPVAVRNTRFARSMAQSIGGMQMPEALEASDSLGGAARKVMQQALLTHGDKEFNIPGLQLGLRYVSRIVAKEIADPPPDDPNAYFPSAYAGSRAPHVATINGSLLDLFGRDFTLLCFTDADTAQWSAFALDCNLPLVVLRVENEAAHALYGADCVLIRPDHHIAWRGSAVANAEKILAQCVAYCLESS